MIIIKVIELNNQQDPKEHGMHNQSSNDQIKGCDLEVKTPDSRVIYVTLRFHL